MGLANLGAFISLAELGIAQPGSLDAPRRARGVQSEGSQIVGFLNPVPLAELGAFNRRTAKLFAVLNPDFTVLLYAQ